MPVIDLGLIISGTNNATSGLRSAGRDLDDLGTHVKKVGENSQETANRLKAIQVVIGGILLEKTLELGKAFIEASSEIQNIDARMAAWTGSIKAASAIMEQMNDKVGASGVKLSSMGDAFVKLRAAGANSTQALTTVESLVNSIAAIGGGDLDGKLGAAATSFQRFLSKGQVSMREMNAIVNETGLTFGDLAKSAGMSLTQFETALRDKTLSATQLLDAFNRASKEKFGDFAELLSSTVGGSLSKFKNDMEETLGGLGANTNLNSAIVGIIRNIDQAFKDWIATITPGDIQNFFKFLESMEPIVVEVGRTILLAGQAILGLAQVTASFLDMLPDEAVEMGIIGYVLLGKKGALLLGLIGVISGQLKTLDSTVRGISDMYNKLPVTQDGMGGSKYQTLLDRLNKQDPGSPVINMFKAMGIAAYATAGDIDKDLTPALSNATNQLAAMLHIGGSSGTHNFKSILPDPKQLADINAEFLKLQAALKNPQGGITPHVNLPGKGDAAEAARALLGAEDTIASVAGKDALLQMKTAGDQLGQTIQGINDTTNQWDRSLGDALLKINQSKLPLNIKKDITAQIEALEAKITQDTDLAIKQAQALNALKQHELDIETQIAVAVNNRAGRDIDMQTAQQGDWQKAAIAGTPGGALAVQVDQQKFDLAQKVLGYYKQIDDLKAKELTDAANSPFYDKQINSLDSLIAKTQEFAANLSADTVLQTQFFQELGSTMNNDLASGISGLIQGTMSWGDVGRKIFGDMIDMAVKYLLQLAEIKLFTMAMSAFGFADGGVFPGGVQPFANGGIPINPNQITPMANGGLTTGPTLFGLMGEAGTEAVMPLTRVGGKLGVHAVGGGGNNYNITVQAIDTQSGMQFVAQHIGSIDAGLRQRQSLNRKG